MHGGLAPGHLVEDALTIAIMETGVPSWALDADRLGGELEVREPTGGRLVIADEGGTVAVLFGDPARARRVTAPRGAGAVRRRRPDVPDLVEEALWTPAENLRTN